MALFLKKILGKLVHAIMSSSESTEHTEESNVEPQLRRSNRIKLQQERKRRLSEDEQNVAGKIKRIKTLCNDHLTMCMDNQLDQVEDQDQDQELQLELEHQEKEQDQELQLELELEHQETEQDQDQELQLELEQQEKEQDFDMFMDVMSHELQLLSQQNENVGQGFTHCVCAEYDGELFKLYDLPNNVKYFIPQNDSREL